MCAVCNPQEIYEVPPELDDLGTQIKAAQDSLDVAWDYVRRHDRRCALLLAQEAYEELALALGVSEED